MHPLAGTQAPFALVFVSVVLACFLAGWRSGLAALVLGQAAAWFYFVEPVNSFALSNPQSIAGLVLATFAELLIVILTGLYQREITKASHAVEEQLRVREQLIAELNHRVKNTLAIIQSFAHQSLAGAATLDEARAAFEGRLDALAEAHRILTRELWQPVSLSELVRETLRPHDGSGERFIIRGSDVPVSPKTAVTIVMTIHELATNATKYGALSTADGQVQVSWSEQSGYFGLLWEEQGGPTVRPSKKRSFGTRMLARAISSELGGSADLQFLSTGLRYEVRAPARVPL